MFIIQIKDDDKVLIKSGINFSTNYDNFCTVLRSKDLG